MVTFTKAVSSGQLKIHSNSIEKIDPTSPIICCYGSDISLLGTEIFLKAVKELPDYQFFMLNGDDKNSIISHSIAEELNNFFLIEVSSDFSELVDTIDLLVVLSQLTYQNRVIIEATEKGLPVVCFSEQVNDPKLLEIDNLYIIAGKPNTDLFMLFIKRFIQHNDSLIPKRELSLHQELPSTANFSETVLDNKEDIIQMQNTTEEFSFCASKLQEQGDLENAIINYKKAIELHLYQPLWVYLNAAACLKLLGKFDEAIELTEQAILIYPQSADLYRLLGLLYNEKKDIEGVIKNYSEAIACDPQQPFWIYCALIELLTLGYRFEEAVTIGNQGLELYPNEPDIHYHFGFLLYKQNDLQSAIEELRKTIKLDSNHFWSNQLLGEILLEVKQWEESSYFLQQAIDIKHDYTWSYFHLGEVSIEQEKWEEAIKFYQKFLEFESDSLDVSEKLNFAIDKLASKSLQKTEAEYLEILKKESNNSEAYFGLANVFNKQSRINKAIAFLEIAIKLNPKRLDAQILLKQVLERKRRLYRAFKIDSDDHLYSLWLQENLPQPDNLDWMPEIVQSLGYKPLMSVIVPTYNAPEEFLREMIQSVLDQTYPYWELCIADDASPQPHVREILEEYASKYDNIKVVFREKNGHISAASNSALELATGEFITLLDHDDLLTPDALYEVVLLLNQHPQADMIYSDEDKLNENNKLEDPYFKPNWCPDSFLARNYVCHLGTYRRSIVQEIGGFRLGYEGSQDYDLVLRFTEKTDKIFHIPKILYHWRIHSSSSANSSEAKPYAYDAGAKALEDALVRRNEPGKVINNERLPGIYTIRYEIQEYKLVSIIIPNRNLGDVLDRCLHSIFEKSTYPNFEVIIVDNGTDEPETLAVFEHWQQREPERFNVHPLDIPFNYSRLNNFGVSFAQGDYLLFLNNDTEIITPDWIESMVEQTQRQSIGVVGAKLLYPDDTIQHAGVVLGLGGVAGHSHKHFPADHLGYVRQLWGVNNYSAVTAACVMCRREVFEEVEGFDETLKVAFNDVDFCLKIQSKGYYNLCLPHVVLYHYESKSRGYEDTPEKQKRFLQEIHQIKTKWGDIIGNDPCYSPNLTRNKENYELNIQTQVTILDVISESHNPEKLYGFHIDTPQPHDHIIGILTVSGWVVGNNCPVSKVELFSEEKTIKTVAVDQPRVDVHQVFPHVPEAANCGFKIFINLIDLLQETELRVRALHEDDNYTLLGIIQLSR